MVITESPRRVIERIQRYVFDEAAPQHVAPVQLVDGVDALDAGLVARMKAEPNNVFVAQVTRVPHRLLQGSATNGEPDVSPWVSVIDRLVLFDCSSRIAPKAARAAFLPAASLVTLYTGSARQGRNEEHHRSLGDSNKVLEVSVLPRDLVLDDRMRQHLRFILDAKSMHYVVCGCLVRPSCRPRGFVGFATVEYTQGVGDR